jgi:hypothetical protein
MIQYEASFGAAEEIIIPGGEASEKHKFDKSPKHGETKTDIYWQTFLTVLTNS